MLNKNKIVSLLKQLKLTTDNSIVNELHAILTQLDAESLDVNSIDAESLNVNDIQISKTVQISRTLDVFALFDAVLEDPFDVESWKASFINTVQDGTTYNGVYEASGDFSTEVSYANIVGISESFDYLAKNTLFGATFFTPTGGAVLNALQESDNAKVGGTFNGEWTYTYEEDSSATGSDPKHIHDFRITINSTQILGYVVINADDSESHNFILDAAGN